MTLTIQNNTLNELAAIYEDSRQGLRWPFPFILPAWMQVWWESFGTGNEMYIRTVKEDNKIIGIAPLMKKDNTASFIGSIDVCDYQDFIVVPGKEKTFFSALLEDLKNHRIRVLDLKHVRPVSLVMNSLAALAEENKLGIEKIREDVSFEMDLPSTFDVYLESLNTKQRHEIRRKLRRLNEEGNIAYHFVNKEPELSRALDTFFKMFVESREDKAAFLTDEMKQYFRAVVKAMAENGLLRLGILELDNKPIAEILCFEYQKCLYLYNSGYDPQYVGLSAGVLSKVLAIKDCIEKGITRFDFLKGAEPYKAHIGGREVPLYHCRITLN
jgi:CelD/BcsL family acetyltransferase involved in cellulose biosynthesis